ncbi:MAG: hypothetical protein JRG95_19130 [Deltaproteobacteria bacterium]|nr:hypothetical protein [Deltaproteobacteria bacterium]
MKRSPAAILLVALLGVGCVGSVEHVTSCEPGDGLVPVCGFINPEDLAVAPGGEWLFVSQYPSAREGEVSNGSLVAFRPSDGAKRKLFPVASTTAETSLGDPSCTEPPDAARFAPHGIDLRHGSHGDQLLVVNHGGREAIEFFAVESADGEPRLRWVGCIPLPDGDKANDVVGLEGDGVIATRMLPRASGPVSMVRMALGWNTGFLLEWQPASGWSQLPGTEDSGPNGVELSPDETQVYYAAWGGKRLVRIGRDGTDRVEHDLDFHPDNLTWSPDGRLLVAGQIDALSGITSCMEKESGTCGLAIAVDALEPGSFELTPLLRHDPARVGGAASVALEHESVLWIGTFSGDRLLRVEEMP